MPASSPLSRMSLVIPGLAHDLEVLRFDGREGISLPFCFDVELVSAKADLNLERFLHQPAFLAFDAQQNGIFGQIQRFALCESSPRISRYQLTLVPRLHDLSLRVNQRIFQNLSVEQIITQVLKEHRLLVPFDVLFQLNATVYPAREYCTQYQENDLHFIRRLCEEEGWHFHFRHSPTGCVLVVGDTQASFQKLSRPTPYVPGNGMVGAEPAVKRWGESRQIRTNRTTWRDYDFERPHVTLESDFSGDQPVASSAYAQFEAYTYAAHALTQDERKRRVRRALERQQLNARVAEGASDEPRLLSGHLLALEGHPRYNTQDRWLLTVVHHEGHQPQALEAYAGSGLSDIGLDFQGYRNTFTAIPSEVFFRPQLEHPKPLVLTSQTAVVTGPPGEEIFCDRFGRVKIRLHWDRSGIDTDKSSCWVRTASSWAGNQYGSQLIPRVGMEVLVLFIEGDCDRPIVHGALFNQTHALPYELPAHKTRSVFKTLSSPGGGGSNELRIEDRKGAEHIFVQAERDLQTRVKHDQTLEVGHEQHILIHGNRYSQLSAEEHHSVIGERKVQLSSNDHLTVAGNSFTQVGQAVVIKAGQEVHLQAGATVVIDAGASLTLKAGGQHIVISAAGIFSSSVILPGGEPSQGTPAACVLPGLAGEPPQATAARLLELMPTQPVVIGPNDDSRANTASAICEMCLLRASVEAQALVAR